MERQLIWSVVVHQDPMMGVSSKFFKKKQSNLEICMLKYLTSIPPASIALFYTH